MPRKEILHPRHNFSRLIESIQPTNGELQKAKSYRLSCRKRLSSSFDIKDMKIIGSHTRKEAIRHYSDLDCLAVLSRNEAKWSGRIVSSDTLTKKVAQDLNDRYTQTKIRRDAQAVVLNFGQGQHSMDVVPALFHKFDTSAKSPVFHIPDGNGGWLETSPEAHNTYIKRANLRSQGKLAKTSQLIRCWKHSRSQTIPISSFYISLFLAATDICTGAKGYAEILHTFFHLMHQRDCKGFRDPVKIAGNIYPSQTNPQRSSLQSSIKTSLNHASKARIAESEKRFTEANKQWNIVFNGQFL